MPAIPPDLLDCVIYLYPSEVTARKGHSFGGSGFVVLVPIGDNPESHIGTIYAVTARHVLREIDKTAGAPVIRLNNEHGLMEVMATDRGAWVEHKEADVAVAPLGMSPGFRFIPIPLARFLSPQDRALYAVGAEAVMVGRFVSHDGKQGNTPAARFGNVAMLPDPDNPVKAEDGSEQESFLVEVRSLPGFSGAPVLVYRSLHTLDSIEGETVPGMRIRFLGVDWAPFPHL